MHSKSIFWFTISQNEIDEKVNDNPTGIIVNQMELISRPNFRKMINYIIHNDYFVLNYVQKIFKNNSEMA